MRPSSSAQVSRKRLPAPLADLCKQTGSPPASSLGIHDLYSHQSIVGPCPSSGRWWSMTLSLLFTVADAVLHLHTKLTSLAAVSSVAAISRQRPRSTEKRPNTYAYTYHDAGSISFHYRGAPWYSARGYSWCRTPERQGSRVQGSPCNQAGGREAFGRQTGGPIRTQTLPSFMGIGHQTDVV